MLADDELTCFIIDEILFSPFLHFWHYWCRTDVIIRCAITLSFRFSFSRGRFHYVYFFTLRLSSFSLCHFDAIIYFIVPTLIFIYIFISMHFHLDADAMAMLTLRADEDVDAMPMIFSLWWARGRADEPNILSFISLMCLIAKIRRAIREFLRCADVHCQREDIFKHFDYRRDYFTCVRADDETFSMIISMLHFINIWCIDYFDTPMTPFSRPAGHFLSRNISPLMRLRSVEEDDDKDMIKMCQRLFSADDIIDDDAPLLM